MEVECESSCGGKDLEDKSNVNGNFPSHCPEEVKFEPSDCDKDLCVKLNVNQVEIDKSLQNEGNDLSSYVEYEHQIIKQEIDTSEIGSVNCENNIIMAKFLEPPTFMSESKSYAEYKSDLGRWSRICGVDKKLQAEIVVYRYDGHPSNIKEKINTQLGDKLQDNADGIKELIKFLDEVYEKNSFADAWDKFNEFSHFNKKSDQNMSEFIAEWENCYQKFRM